MQPQDHKNQDAQDSASTGRTSVSTKTERRPSSLPYLLNQPSAVDEARQMLDEIAGDEAHLRPKRSRRQPSKSKIVWLNLWYGLRHLLASPGRADFRLVREMRQFLKHPGHFFWFNRIAPERAAEHFGTSSTDAMTHHARRYGAHAAMMILAVIVVFFGGFSGLATKLMSAYAEVPDAPRIGGDLMITGDTRELYVSALAGNTTLAMPRRIEVLTIKEGETLRSIAADRNISLDTLLWANEMFDPDTQIKGGQKLIVPPVTGMLHIANQGDTVGKIAEFSGRP